MIHAGGDWFSHELVLVSAPDDAALVAAARDLKLFLDRSPHAPLAAVAYTCAKRFVPGGAALACVTGSCEELRLRLASAADRIAAGAERIRDRSGTYFVRRAPGSPPPKLAFVFPGALSFYPDMMRDIALLFPVCRAAFDFLEEAMAGEERFTPSSFVFPPAERYRRDADVFAAGGYAEAMIAVMSATDAMLRLLNAAGLRPDAVAGLSGGDLMALAHTGAIRFKNRGVKTAFFQAAYALAAKVVKGMPALSGRRVALDPEWSVRFRSDIRSFAKHWMKEKPSVPVYSFAQAAPLSDSFRAARDGAAEIWYERHRIEDTARRMYDDGIRLFVETGPRSLMCTAFRDALRNRRDAEVVPTNRAHRSGLVQLQHALALVAAHGVPFDPMAFFDGRREREIDFAAPLSVEVRAGASLTLRREFPRPRLPEASADLNRVRLAGAGASAPGARAKGRAAAQAAKERRQRQFDFGASQPLVSDAEFVFGEGGTSVSVVKTFAIDDVPLFADAALCAERISYADESLRGYTPLSVFNACEIMAETALRLVPGKRLVSVSGLQTPRTLAFSQGRLRLAVRAERVLTDRTTGICVKATLREDAADAPGTAGAFEAAFLFDDAQPARPAFEAAALPRARSVNLAARDIYPACLFSGERLRGILGAERWSETGLDYDVEVPPSATAVTHTRFPVWEANPQLLAAVADGFSLWRAQKRLEDYFSFAFRIGRISLYAPIPQPGTRLKCYLRLADVTPTTHIADIRVSDGNGKLVLAIDGYEELVEHVPPEYVHLVRMPTAGYLMREFDTATTDLPETSAATAWTDDVPYALFDRNDGIWLDTVSRIMLARSERRRFDSSELTRHRRVEWLYGRIAAKEAVRRYLERRYHARWSSADVEIWPDEMGKPRPLGKWEDFLPANLDVSISHTADFVVAIAGEGVRLGIDTEFADRDLPSEFVLGVFTTEELELGAAKALDKGASVRFWCAKEAVSKALGTGLRYSPRDLVVTAYRPEDGTLDVSLSGPWLEKFKMLKGRPVRVKTALVRRHVVATCALPETLFAGGT